MRPMDFAGALRQARGADPGAIPDILATTAAALGASDLVLYLVDFGRTVLEPIPDRSTHAELPVSEPVVGSMAGRALTDQQVVSAERDGGVRVWVPVLEASECTGVLAFTVASAAAEVLAAGADLGLLAGLLIAVHARSTDLYNLHRRRHSMSLAASMQWDLLPPLTLRSGVMTAAGVVEPAYDVGGDCFDFAANGVVFDFAVMDAMGHGLGSALVAALAMGCYRNGRREARSLTTMHRDLASTIAAQHPEIAFATGVLGRIDTLSGVMTWTNAGHPLPLLVRGGHVITELACEPTPPWGLLDGSPTTATQQLEPGDSVLLYTDGVTEARTADGDSFGVARLIEVTQRHASDLVDPVEVIRLVVRSVLDHQADLADDATLVLLRWDGPAGASS